MTFYSPGQIFLHIGPISIRYYGLMYLLAFLLVSFAIKKLAFRYKLEAETLINCALVCFLGGICGARFYFVLLCWPYFLNHMWEIIALWQGGLSIHGGIIGAALAGVWYAKKKKLPVLSTADILGTVVPLGQAIGRWGNFFNCELFGLPVSADFPFKQYIPPAMRPEQFANCEFFHPTFLYESVWDLVLFFALYFVVLPRFNKHPGITFFIYIAGYSLGRILIEPIRVDSIMFGTTKIPLVASWVFLLLSLAAITILYMKDSRTDKNH